MRGHRTGEIFSSDVTPLTFCRNGKRVYRPSVTGAEPFMRGKPMRDFVADWKRWSRAERAFALIVSITMIAAPLGLLVEQLGR